MQNETIKTYVDQNIEVFVNDIVLSTGDSMGESEDAFIELLNSENLMTETKDKLIEKNNCVVSDITRIKGAEIQLVDGENESIDIRNLLYKCKKVSPTWQNIFENFKKMKVSEDEFKNSLPEKYGDGVLDFENFKYKVLKKQ